jgi:hypothetical protein
VEGVRVLTYEMLRHAGTIIQHAVGVLILCWRRMLRAMSLAGLVGLVLAELAGSLTTHSFPPAPLTHVVAFMVAAALAYAAALTVLVDELLAGAIATVRVAEGDVSAGARALAVLARREAAEAGQGIRRRLESPPKSGSVTLAPHDGSGDGARGDGDVRYEDVSAETLADIAATEEFSNTAPHPRVDARPVRADQFPRIEWAADLTGDPGLQMLVPPGRVASAPMPPIPLRGETPPVPPAPDSSLTERPPDLPPRTVPVTTRPLTGDEGDGDVRTPPSDRSIAENDGSHAQAQERSLAGSRQRRREEAVSGLWSRIGRALVGNTRPLEAAEREDVAAQGSDDTPAGP